MGVEGWGLRTGSGHLSPLLAEEYDVTVEQAVIFEGAEPEDAGGLALSLGFRV
jgi:hypothetical protein